MPPVTFEHDSPLGRWRHTEWSPKTLAGVVERIWHFDGLTTHRKERAFPSRLSELIVQLGGTYREARGGGPFDPCPRVCLSGIQTTPNVIESPERPGAILGIRLTPIGTYLLLGGPAHPVSNWTVDLADLFGARARELEDRVAGAADPAGRVRLAARWIEEQIAGAARPDPGVAWVAAEVERAHGAVRIGSLRDRIGYGKARLATKFREQIGLSPKAYARVLRFRRALELVNAGDGSLAAIAGRTGYYDQAHMNADFRELGGLTPTDFAAATRYENSVNLAEQ